MVVDRTAAKQGAARGGKALKVGNASRVGVRARPSGEMRRPPARGRTVRAEARRISRASIAPPESQFLAPRIPGVSISSTRGRQPKPLQLPGHARAILGFGGRAAQQAVDRSHDLAGVRHADDEHARDPAGRRDEPREQRTDAGDAALRPPVESRGFEALARKRRDPRFGDARLAPGLLARAPARGRACRSARRASGYGPCAEFARRRLRRRCRRV